MRDFFSITKGEAEPTANEIAAWREARITADRRLAPRHPAMAAYAAAHGLGSVGEGPDGQGPTLEAWDPERHGTREEVEAAVEAWAQERAKADAERAELEAQQKAESDAAEAERKAAIAADKALVDFAKEMTPEVFEAMKRIASAGAERLLNPTT